MQRCPEREILTHGQRGFRGIVVPHIVNVSAMGRRIVSAIDATVANGTLSHSGYLRSVCVETEVASV